jgi:hypothetical protein
MELFASLVTQDGVFQELHASVTQPWMLIVKLGVVQFVKLVTLDTIMDLQVSAHHGVLLILTALFGEFLSAVIVALVITDLMAYAHHGLLSTIIA